MGRFNGEGLRFFFRERRRGCRNEKSPDDGWSSEAIRMEIPWIKVNPIHAGNREADHPDRNFQDSERDEKGRFLTGVCNGRDKQERQE